MDDRNGIWITGTVISASGYPRKNAEVRGVLFAGTEKIGAASSTTDYSGQYFLTIEPDDGIDFETLDPNLHIDLAASSHGETSEFGTTQIVLDGNAEFEREIRLAASPHRLAAQTLRAA